MAALPGMRAPDCGQGARTAHGLAGKPTGLGAVNELLLAEAALALRLRLLAPALCQPEHVASRRVSTNTSR
jgi:hypothetical protein